MGPEIYNERTKFKTHYVTRMWITIEKKKIIVNIVHWVKEELRKSEEWIGGNIGIRTVYKRATFWSNFDNDFDTLGI